MRTFILAVAAIVGLISLPARADHSHAVVSFGFGYGYPAYPVGPYPYGFYRPYYPYGPWYGYPTVGIGVGVTPHVGGHSEEKSGGGGQQQALKMYVYPAAGQSESQMSEDRYQCHVWAAGQSGYDPTLGTGKREDADGYTRAFTACMQGRNYVVK
jgi:hypothetical protein